MEASEANKVAAKATQGFPVFQCEECAEKVKKELMAAGHKGQQIEIRGKKGKPFLVCLSYDGGKAAISENGRHLGIRVEGLVFDNLHPQGMPYDQWLQDFDGRDGVIVHRVEDF